MKYPRWFSRGAATAKPVRRTLVKLVNRPLRRLPASRPLVTYDHDGFPLRLPLSHPLPRILAVDANYQTPLRWLAQAITNGTPGIGIDVGANVGDTAVTMALGGCTTVVCIEGNAAFLPALHANVTTAGSRGWRFEVVDRYVGTGGPSSAHVETRFGTARLVESGGSDVPAEAFVPAASILADHATVAVLKIDTDGMDLQLLHAFLEADANRAIRSVFVEFDPSAEDIVQQSDFLAGHGFTHLHWFDHSGNFVRTTPVDDHAATEQLTAHARAGHVYYDVAAIRDDAAARSRLESAVPH